MICRYLRPLAVEKYAEVEEARACLLIVVSGRVRKLSSTGTELEVYGPGRHFGQLSVAGTKDGESDEDNGPYGIVADETSVLATLSDADYTTVKGASADSSWDAILSHSLSERQAQYNLDLQNRNRSIQKTETDFQSLSNAGMVSDQVESIVEQSPRVEGSEQSMNMFDVTQGGDSLQLHVGEIGIQIFDGDQNVKTTWPFQNIRSWSAKKNVAAVNESDTGIFKLYLTAGSTVEYRTTLEHARDIKTALSERAAQLSAEKTRQKEAAAKNEAAGIHALSSDIAQETGAVGEQMFDVKQTFFKKAPKECQLKVGQMSVQLFAGQEHQHQHQPLQSWMYKDLTIWEYHKTTKALLFEYKDKGKQVTVTFTASAVDGEAVCDLMQQHCHAMVSVMREQKAVQSAVESEANARRRMSVSEHGVSGVTEIAAKLAAESGAVGERIFYVTQKKFKKAPRECQLKVGQMNVMLFAGPNVYASWMYTMMDRWEYFQDKKAVVLFLGAVGKASPESIPMGVGTDAEGEEICELMQKHALQMVKAKKEEKAVREAAGDAYVPPEEAKIRRIESVSQHGVSGVAELAAKLAAEAGAVGERMFEVALTAKRAAALKKAPKECQLKVGQMNVQLFAGSQVYTSWMYTALKSWEYSNTTKIVTVIVNKSEKDPEHSIALIVSTNELGEEICELMREHAVELAKAKKKQKAVAAAAETDNPNRAARNHSLSISERVTALAADVAEETGAVGERMFDVTQTFLKKGAPKECQLKVGQMNIQLMAGSQMYQSWMYIALAKWEYAKKTKSISIIAKGVGGGKEKTFGLGVEDDATGEKILELMREHCTAMAKVMKEQKQAAEDTTDNSASAGHVMSISERVTALASDFAEETGVLAESMFDVTQTHLKKAPKECQLKIGQMNIQLFAGHQPLQSWVYSSCKRWGFVAEKMQFTLAVKGSNGKDENFGFGVDSAAQGAQMAELMRLHCAAMKKVMKEQKVTQAAENSGDQSPSRAHTLSHSERMTALTADIAQETGAVGEQMFDVKQTFFKKAPKECQLKVGQMSVQLFAGQDVLASWMYSNLVKWEYSKSLKFLTLVSRQPAQANGSSSPRNETVALAVSDNTEGLAIVSLMEQHCSEMAKVLKGQQDARHADLAKQEAQRVALLREVSALIGTTVRVTRTALLRKGSEVDSEVVGEMAIDETTKVFNVTVNEHLQVRVQVDWAGEKVWTSMASKSGVVILEPQSEPSNASEVEQWLLEFRLEKYCADFAEAGIHFIADLMDTDADQTKQIILSATMKVAEAKRLRRQLRVLQLSVAMADMMPASSNGQAADSEHLSNGKRPIAETIGAASGQPDDVSRAIMMLLRILHLCCSTTHAHHLPPISSPILPSRLSAAQMVARRWLWSRTR